jgi:hypothetical protein
MPIFATWRPNKESAANTAVEALLPDKLKVTDLLLGGDNVKYCGKSNSPCLADYC